MENFYANAKTPHSAALNCFMSAFAFHSHSARLFLYDFLDLFRKDFLPFSFSFSPLQPLFFRSSPSASQRSNCRKRREKKLQNNKHFVQPASEGLAFCICSLSCLEYVSSRIRIPFQGIAFGCTYFVQQTSGGKALAMHWIYRFRFSFKSFPVLVLLR